ncbi:MAG: Uma2 family endonuclease [Armatimonadetes bacterium]|nr:Uma2 family endonuclease [Armatimonadota bacterium]
MALTLERERVEETAIRFVYPRPITFNEWLEISGTKDFDELIDGTIVEKPMVQLEHEKLNLWLFQVLGTFVDEKRLGTVLGSRSPVFINEFRGRMPDFFFVHKSREEVITSKATLGAPDLVIEIVSPNDRRSGINATETDYRAIGVAEIVYIDQPKTSIRVLRKTDTGYEPQTLATGDPLVLQSMGGVTLEWNWIFTEPRSSVLATVQQLLSPKI